MTKPVSKTMFMLVIGGGYVVAFVLMVIAMIALIGGAAAAQNAAGSNSEPAMNAAMASGAGLLFVALACLAVPVVAFLILIYKAWSAIQDGQVRTTPGLAVGLLFIPVFHWYWIFQAVWGWAQDYNGYATRHNVPGEKMSDGLFLVYCICSLIFLPGALVLMFFVVAKMCDGINAIAATPKTMAAVAR